jgi:hypothetical protein
VAVVGVAAVVLVLTMMVMKATIEAFLQMPRMMLDDPRHQRRFLQSRLPKTLPNQYQPVPRILQPLQMSRLRNTRTKRSLVTSLTSWNGGGGSVMSFRSQQQ